MFGGNKVYAFRQGDHHFLCESCDYSIITKLKEVMFKEHNIVLHTWMTACVEQIFLKSYDVVAASERVASVPDADTYKLASRKLNYETTFQNFLVEKDSESSLWDWNTFLLRVLDPQDQICYYIFKGEKIFTFCWEEEFGKHIPSRGNGASPYAIGFGKKNLYL